MTSSKNVLTVTILSLLLAFSCVACDSSDEEGTDACENVSCSGHGTCVDNDGVASCTCDEGFTADGVECVETVDVCEGVTCSDSGACVAVGDRASCTCNPGFVANGLACEPEVDVCDGVACSDNGTCVAVDGAATCECDEGYEADGLECVALDPCADMECMDNAECVVGEDGTAACSCLEGYVLDGEVCVADDPCSFDALRTQALTEGTVALNGVSRDSYIPWAEIIAVPADFEGRVVQTVALVDHICSRNPYKAKVRDQENNFFIIRDGSNTQSLKAIAAAGDFIVGEGQFFEEGPEGPEILIDLHGALILTPDCE